MDRMRRTNANSNGYHSLVMDPRRELADSLPICHPDDYLTDFQPMSRKLGCFEYIFLNKIT